MNGAHPPLTQGTELQVGESNGVGSLKEQQDIGLTCAGSYYGRPPNTA